MRKLGEGQQNESTENRLETIAANLQRPTGSISDNITEMHSGYIINSCLDKFKDIPKPIVINSGSENLEFPIGKKLFEEYIRGFIEFDIDDITFIDCKIINVDNYIVNSNEKPLKVCKSGRKVLSPTVLNLIEKLNTLKSRLNNYISRLGFTNEKEYDPIEFIIYLYFFTGNKEKTTLGLGTSDIYEIINYVYGDFFTDTWDGFRHFLRKRLLLNLRDEKTRQHTNGKLNRRNPIEAQSEYIKIRETKRIIFINWLIKNSFQTVNEPTAEEKAKFDGLDKIGKIKFIFESWYGITDFSELIELNKQSKEDDSRKNGIGIKNLADFMTQFLSDTSFGKVIVNHQDVNNLFYTK